MQSKLRRRLGALTAAVVLGAAGSAALPASEAQARYCAAPAATCSSETLYSFAGYALDVYYSIPSRDPHLVKVFVNNHEYCRWSQNGLNRKWTCYRLPVGPAYGFIGNQIGFDMQWLDIRVAQG